MTLICPKKAQWDSSGNCECDWKFHHEIEEKRWCYAMRRVSCTYRKMELETAQ